MYAKYKSDCKEINTMQSFNPSEENLRRVFEEGFSVRDIASGLASFGQDVALRHHHAG